MEGKINKGGYKMHQSHTTCSECLLVLDSTEWRPPEGIDPNMREFKCERCNTTVYKIIHGSKRKEVQLNML